MARLKYADGVPPLRKEQKGYTFQSNHYGQSTFPGQKNDRKRYPQQWYRQQCNQKAVRNWRNMPAEVKQRWNAYAMNFPEPTKADPNKFISGYQHFVKRNFYRFLHDGIEAEFIVDPKPEILPAPEFEISITDTGTCIDMTEEYIRNFGLLPKIGQFIIVRILPMAIESGQFFAPLIATLEVQELRFDGLICTFEFINPPKGIVFSLYASFPVYESEKYPGTKFRYMGCFKPSTFLQLTDTPATYEGQAGKVPVVAPEEDRLIFENVSGGVDTFLELSDTPSTYNGHAMEFVIVDPDENKLVFFPLFDFFNFMSGGYVRAFSVISVYFRASYPFPGNGASFLNLVDINFFDVTNGTRHVASGQLAAGDSGVFLDLAPVFSNMTTLVSIDIVLSTWVIGSWFMKITFSEPIDVHLNFVFTNVTTPLSVP